LESLNYGAWEIVKAAVEVEVLEVVVVFQELGSKIARRVRDGEAPEVEAGEGDHFDRGLSATRFWNQPDSRALGCGVLEIAECGEGFPCWYDCGFGFIVGLFFQAETLSNGLVEFVPAWWRVGPQIFQSLLVSCFPSFAAVRHCLDDIFLEVHEDWPELRERSSDEID